MVIHMNLRILTDNCLKEISKETGQVKFIKEIRDTLRNSQLDDTPANSVIIAGLFNRLSIYLHKPLFSTVAKLADYCENIPEVTKRPSKKTGRR
jgi:hypothetical protein